MTTNPGSDFIQWIRDVLTHLYDHVYLQRHPLAERLVPPQQVATRTRDQELRRIFLDTMEALNPGDNIPIRHLICFEKGEANV